MSGRHRARTLERAGVWHLRVHGRELQYVRIVAGLPIYGYIAGPGPALITTERQLTPEQADTMQEAWQQAHPVTVRPRPGTAAWSPFDADGNLHLPAEDGWRLLGHTVDA